MGRRGLYLAMLAAAAVAGGCSNEAAPDQASPKAAAITFTKALEAGDLATARRMSNASGFEGELLEAMAESASGMSRLTQAADARLGEEARKITAQHAAISMTKMLAEGQVEQTGNRATVVSKDGGRVQVLRIDGQWRVDVGALTRGQDVTQVIVFLRAAGLGARQVADDIDVGRITSVAQAQEAMVGRVTANLPRRLRAGLIARPATTRMS